MAKGLKRGIYATEYGNAAYVAGPKARRAYDLDMAEHIPMEMVTDKFIRSVEAFDEALYQISSYDYETEE